MGAKNQTVNLQAPAFTVHPTSNEKVAGWDPDGVHVWGELTPLTSRELVRTRQVQVDATHRLRIHYRTDVNTTWRVRWTDPRGSHTAAITGIVETVRRRELELQLNETTANGKP